MIELKKSNAIDDLYQVFFSGDMQRFVSQTFDYLLSMGNGRLPTPQVDELRSLLVVIRRWLQVAPVATPKDQWVLLTARKFILACLHATDSDVTEYYTKVFGDVNDVLTLSPDLRMKFALLASIDCECSVDLEGWRAISKEEVVFYLLAILTDEPISEQGLIRYNNVVQTMVGVLSEGVLSADFIADLSLASFHLSYSTVKEKYLAKRALVRLARRMLDQKGVRDTVFKPFTVSAKPTLCIISEHLTDNHAMHRCYGELLESLKGRFRTVLFASSPSSCHAQLADQVIYFEGTEQGFNELVEQVKLISPEVLLYPSVGMMPWTFALSTLRLAPIQIALIGHPMPTCSDQIDYLALQENIPLVTTITCETFLFYKHHPVDIELYKSSFVKKLYEETINKKAVGPILIGITASPWKLNAGFMRTLRQLQDKSGGAVVFRFFPNAQGLRFLSVQKKINRWFPDAEVLPSTNFNRYLEQLSQCSLLLQSFPFGGTNTTLDALGIGMPIVCMDGDDIHSRTDSAILETLGLSALLVRDVTQYVDLALKLISNDVLRKQLGTQAREAVLRMQWPKADDQNLPEKIFELVLQCAKKNGAGGVCNG